jgi:tyrosine-protein kinase receptor torso
VTADDAFVLPRWSVTHESHGQSSNQLTVAVKMLTGDQSDVYRQDFLREMELMKSIGYHSNVVNMIGCCTRQEPLCLVVEHVALGDLLHYLQDYRANCQQAHGSGDFEYLTVHDLMYFARQISIGMEFLSQKGFVHRDLAARNVLVGHEKKVKIGDFGLTRYIYDDQVYVTNRGGKLPLKWMAIESIFDLTFTTASDVWSFGIVLYELMSLGGTPYPTISNKDLLRELQKGYRMERSDNCSPEIYRLMIDCWQTRPNRRPTFTQLNRRIAAILDDSHASSQLVLPTNGFLYENDDKTNSSDSFCFTHTPTHSPTETTPVIIDLKTPNQCAPKLADVKADTVNCLISTPEFQLNMSDYRNTPLENELAN